MGILSSILDKILGSGSSPIKVGIMRGRTISFVDGEIDEDGRLRYSGDRLVENPIFYDVYGLDGVEKMIFLIREDKMLDVNGEGVSIITDRETARSLFIDVLAEANEKELTWWQWLSLILVGALGGLGAGYYLGLQAGLNMVHP